MNRFSASYKKVKFKFKIPAGTSRGILTEKLSYFIIIKDKEADHKDFGIGEVSILPGLSPESNVFIEDKLDDICRRADLDSFMFYEDLTELPAVRFGLEMAFQDLKCEDEQIFFPSRFTQGKDFIKINGLIWMGKHKAMLRQIKAKLDGGFDCIKIKIGAISLEDELDLIKYIRTRYSKEEVEIRVDANGAFTPENVERVLDLLAGLDVHSIEQPIKPGQISSMATICKNSPVPIALDEELISVNDPVIQKQLLSDIKPNYLIIKPSLLGGFSDANKWIDLAKEEQIKWWITSALESNIGLNAIAQWTYLFKNVLPHGLGTGSLFTNNIPSPVTVNKSQLSFAPNTFFNQLFFINS